MIAQYNGDIKVRTLKYDAVGFAVSSLITNAVDEEKAFKEKTFREAAKDSIFKFGKSIFG